MIFVAFAILCRRATTGAVALGYGYHCNVRTKPLVDGRSIDMVSTRTGCRISSTQNKNVDRIFCNYLYRQYVNFVDKRNGRVCYGDGN